MNQNNLLKRHFRKKKKEINKPTFFRKKKENHENIN